LTLQDVFPQGRYQMVQPYPFAVLQQMRAEREKQGGVVIDASFGSPDHTVPDSIFRAMVSRYQKSNRGYTVKKMTEKLRRTFVRRQARFYELELDPEFTPLLYGIKMGLAQLFYLLGSGNVLSPAVCYPIHLWGPAFSGMHVIPYKVIPDLPRSIAHANENTLKAEGGTAVIICNPYNPGGSVTDENELREVGKYCTTHNILMIYDAAYIDIVEEGAHAPSMVKIMGTDAMLVELFSMSKSYGLADLRVAFMYGNPEVTAKFSQFRDFFEYGHFKPVLSMAHAALEYEDNFVADVSDRYRTCRRIVYEGLTRAGFEVEKPAGSIVCWGKVPQAYRRKGGSFDFGKDLLNECDVLVSPGSGFGEEGEGHFRFAHVMSPEDCTEAVSRMAQFNGC